MRNNKTNKKRNKGNISTDDQIKDKKKIKKGKMTYDRLLHRSCKVVCTF